MIRISALLALLALLAACGGGRLDTAPKDLGAFQARVIHVYTEKALQWPLSRDAEHSEWTALMKNALDTRLRRYRGVQEYDVAVTLEGFMLAPAGVPVLFSPKSTAVVNVFVYDVAGKKFLARKHQMEIFESTTGESALLGSGHARTKAEQIQGLSSNIAYKVEEWMAEQHQDHGWFAARAPAGTSGLASTGAPAPAAPG